MLLSPQLLSSTLNSSAIFARKIDFESGDGVAFMEPHDRNFRFSSVAVEMRTILNALHARRYSVTCCLSRSLMASLRFGRWFASVAAAPV